jgi:hypothetical protein
MCANIRRDATTLIVAHRQDRALDDTLDAIPPPPK